MSEFVSRAGLTRIKKAFCWIEPASPPAEISPTERAATFYTDLRDTVDEDPNIGVEEVRRRVDEELLEGFFQPADLVSIVKASEHTANGVSQGTLLERALSRLVPDSSVRTRAAIRRTNDLLRLAGFLEGPKL